MMKYLKRILRGYAASLDLAKRRGQLYRLEFEPGPMDLMTLAATQEREREREREREAAKIFWTRPMQGL